MNCPPVVETAHGVIEGATNRGPEFWGRGLEVGTCDAEAREKRAVFEPHD